MLRKILIALVIAVVGLAVVIAVQPATFRVSRTATIAAAPAAAGTTVTWTMSGDNNFLSKAFCLFTGGTDKMIGPGFEKGLAQMKAAAEAKK
jgi:hypothetical protein